MMYEDNDVRFIWNGKVERLGDNTYELEYTGIIIVLLININSTDKDVLIKNVVNINEKCETVYKKNTKTLIKNAIQMYGKTSSIRTSTIKSRNGQVEGKTIKMIADVTNKKAIMLDLRGETDFSIDIIEGLIRSLVIK